MIIVYNNGFKSKQNVLCVDNYDVIKKIGYIISIKIIMLKKVIKKKKK